MSVFGFYVFKYSLCDFIICFIEKSDGMQQLLP